MYYTIRGAIIGALVGASLGALLGLTGCGSQSPSELQRTIEPARPVAFGWAVR